MPEDAKELAIPRNSSLNKSTRNGEVKGNHVLYDLDFGEDAGPDYVGARHELSKANFASKICLVWDPSRTSGHVALEAHMGAHAFLNSSEVQAWEVRTANRVIESIGGIQSLLQRFQLLLGGNISDDEGEKQTDDDQNQRHHIKIDNPPVLIPNLLLLLASFVRKDSDNAREFLRCGGVEIVEYWLERSRKSKEMHAVRTSRSLAKFLVYSLLDLRHATSHHVALEAKVFSRLLFNLQLWFGGVSKLSGIALHAELFPVLSDIAKHNPNKVRDCVDVRDMIQYISELTNVDEVRMPNRLKFLEPCILLITDGSPVCLPKFALHLSSCPGIAVISAGKTSILSF